MCSRGIYGESSRLAYPFPASALHSSLSGLLRRAIPRVRGESIAVAFGSMGEMALVSALRFDESEPFPRRPATESDALADEDRIG
jgi:hypothetical protein